MRSLVSALVGVGLLMVAPTAQADPFTIDHLLRHEDIGAVSIDPTDRRVVIERLKPMDSAPTYAFGYYTAYLRTELLAIELDAPVGAHRLLDESEGEGHVVGAWSPSGDHLLIYRLRDQTWRAGVVTVATRTVQWLEGLTPELAVFGRVAHWRSDDELILIVRSEGDLPWHLRMPWQTTARLPELWANAQNGVRSSHVAVGSGEWRNVRDQSEPGRLVRVDVASGDVETLAVGAFYDLEVSPNGRFAAIGALEELTPVDPDAPIYQADIHQRRGLAIVDLETGARWDPCDTCDLAPNLLTWSETKDQLLVWWRDPQAEDPLGNGLSRIDPVGRTLETVRLYGLELHTLETGEQHRVVIADWLADAPVVYARQAAGRSDWYRLGENGAESLTEGLEAVSWRLAAVDRDALLIFADGGVWRVDGRGDPERLTPRSETVAPAGRDWQARGLRLHFNNAPRRNWAVATTRRGHVIQGGVAAEQPVTLGETRVGDVLTASRRAALRSTTSPHGVRTLQLDHSRHGVFDILILNAAYGGLRYARRQSVAHVGPRGEALTSWLYLPPAPQEAPPPLVVVVYPGAIWPEPNRWMEPGGQATVANAQVLANAGYAVLVPSLPRGHAGGQPAAGLAEEILAIVDVAAAGGEFDPERIALWGHSFGAYGAVVAATQSSRFRSIIAANGLYDMVRNWGEFTPHQRIIPRDGLSIAQRAGGIESGQGALGVPPWSDPERYVRNSPFFHADRIEAPVLLIAGDQDYVPLSHSEALFSALYRQGKDALLLSYFGEGHVLFSPGNIRHQYDEVFRWLDRTLRDRSSSPITDEPRNHPMIEPNSR